MLKILEEVKKNYIFWGKGGILKKLYRKINLEKKKSSLKTK
jgi:hypothetical protein